MENLLFLGVPILKHIRVPCLRDRYNYVSYVALIGYIEQNLFLA